MLAIRLVRVSIGLLLGIGIAANLRLHTPKVFTPVGVGMRMVANTSNLAADISAMGEALRSTVGEDGHFRTVVNGIITGLLQVFVHFRLRAPLLKGHVYGGCALLRFLACVVRGSGSRTIAACRTSSSLRLSE